MRLLFHGLQPNHRPYASATQHEWRAGEEREVEDEAALMLLIDFGAAFSEVAPASPPVAAVSSPALPSESAPDPVQTAPEEPPKKAPGKPKGRRSSASG